MKTLITLLSFLLFLSAQAQYTVNWSKAPLNPIPEQYTLNHHKFIGNVSYWDNVYAKTVTFFNEEGKAYKQTSQFGDTKWTYNSSGHLVEKDMGGSMDFKIKYTTNEKGFITSLIYEDGVTTTFNYNSKGLYVSKITRNLPEEKYEYDEQGRLHKLEMFEKGKPKSTVIYTYKETPKGLEVNSTTTNLLTNKITTDTKIFNKRGDMIFGETIENKYTYDHHNNLLHGNFGNYPFKNEFGYYEPKVEPSYNCTEGDCQNGFGTLKTDGGIYIGFFEKGKFSDFGMFTWDSGDNYGGSWKDGQRSGFGVYKFKNGNLQMGIFKDGLLNGTGLLKTNEGGTYGKFADGKVVLKYDYNINSVSSGCLAGNCYNEFGDYRYDNGSTFTGFFQNNTRLFGIYKDITGYSYIGEFGEDGEFEGFGYLTFQNGDAYSGYFKDGKRNGKGIFVIKKSDERRIGLWSNDQLVKGL